MKTNISYIALIAALTSFVVNDAYSMNENELQTTALNGRGKKRPNKNNGTSSEGESSSKKQRSEPRKRDGLDCLGAAAAIKLELIEEEQQTSASASCEHTFFASKQHPFEGSQTTRGGRSNSNTDTNSYMNAACHQVGYLLRNGNDELVPELLKSMPAEIQQAFKNWAYETVTPGKSAAKLRNLIYATFPLAKQPVLNQPMQIPTSRLNLTVAGFLVDDMKCGWSSEAIKKIEACKTDQLKEICDIYKNLVNQPVDSKQMICIRALLEFIELEQRRRAH